MRSLPLEIEVGAAGGDGAAIAARWRISFARRWV